MKRTTLLTILGAILALAMIGGVAWLMAGTDRAAAIDASERSAVDYQAESARVTSEHHVPAIVKIDYTKARIRGGFDAGGKRTLLYSGPSAVGDFECLAYHGPTHIGHACDSTRDQKHKVAFIELFDGGPDPRTMSDRHIVGVADAGVGRLAVVNERGILRTVSLTQERSFLYVVPVTELRAGVEPAALIVFDLSGTVLERIPLK